MLTQPWNDESLDQMWMWRNNLLRRGVVVLFICQLSELKGENAFFQDDLSLFVLDLRSNQPCAHTSDTKLVVEIGNKLWCIQPGVFEFYLLLQKASNNNTDSPTEVWMVFTKRDSKPKIFIEKCYRTSTRGICERFHGDCLHILTLFQIISITQYN